MEKRFASDSEIPDLCPPELLLPNEERYIKLAVPDEAGMVTPVELSWLMFTEEKPQPPSWHMIKQILQHAPLLGNTGEVHNDIAGCYWMNHSLRVIARIALDPRRYQRFDFAVAYDMDRGKRFPVEGERVYFERFHDTFGVVDRS